MQVLMNGREFEVHSLFGSEIWKTQTALEYRSSWVVPPYRPDGRVLRIRIHRDLYDAQSYAISELFDGSKWQRIDSLPEHERRSMTAHWTCQDLDAALPYFEVDDRVLLRRALRILNAIGEDDG